MILKRFSLQLADLLSRGRCREVDLAVLSLYSGQVRLLRDRSLSGVRVEASTVDGFQGREAEVVIVTTVRAAGNRGEEDVLWDTYCRKQKQLCVSEQDFRTTPGGSTYC